MSGLLVTFGLVQPALDGNQTVHRIKRKTMVAELNGGSS